MAQPLMPTTPDAEPGEIAQWRLNLEQAQGHLLAALRLLQRNADWVIDLEQLSGGLVAVCEHLYLAFDEIHDPLTEVRKARTRLAESLSFARTSEDGVILGVADTADAASPFLAAADDQLAPLFHRPPEPPGELRASMGTPRLHDLVRPRLLPVVRLPPKPEPEVTRAEPPPIATSKTFDELDEAIKELENRAKARREAAEERKQQLAEKLAGPEKQIEEKDVPEGFQRDPLPKQSVPEFLRDAARHACEEIAMVGIARLPLPGDPWRTMAFLDQRMLNNIDALAALGPEALRFVEEWGIDSPTPAASKVFAAAAGLGSFRGRDTLAAAERVFHEAELSDSESRALFANALSLCPHPDVPLLVRRLLSEPSPERRAIGVRVAIAREIITDEQLERAAFDEPAVVARALPLFALSGSPRVTEAINRAWQMEQPETREACWQAMAYSADPRLLPSLEAELESERAERAIVYYGVFGGAREARQLLDWVSAGPTPHNVTALGWAGTADAIELLIGVLRTGDDDSKLAAAYALERITAAQLWEHAEVPPEDIEVEDVPEPDVGEEPEPLARQISDPRDVPEQGSPDEILRPSLRLDWWLWFKKEHGERFAPGTRYRCGEPYTPLVVQRELNGPLRPPGERMMLQRELIVRTGDYVRFDVNDFVPVQEASIEAWEPLCSRASGQPGSWVTPARR